MINKVRKFMDEHQLTERGDRILVGFSGGADSVCLLNVMLKLADSLGFDVAAAHVNHGLRGEEATRDAEFCRQVCDKNGIPFHLCEEDVPSYATLHKCSVETAAREVRYASLRNLMAEYGYNKLAVAHHAGDNAETVLMHLMRGSGSEGLRGILPKRDVIIRPLLCVAREEIESYIDENQLDFFTDSTNADVTYTRNRVRHSLINLIRQEYNPNIVHTLSDTAFLMACDHAYMDAQADACYAEVVREDFASILIERKRYKQLADAISLRVMKKAISALLGKSQDISFETIKRCHTLCISGENGKTVPIGDALCAVAEYDAFVIGKLGEEVDYSYNLMPGDVLIISEIGAVLRAELTNSIHRDTANVVYLDARDLTFPLIVRNRRKGDRIAPDGMQGTKKLQDYFVDEKIPQRLRKLWPIVCSQEQILWICGKRKSRLYKPTGETILMLTYEEREL